MANERNKTGQWLPGSGGRPPGAKQKLSAAVYASVLKEWTENPETIKIVRIEDPVQFVKIAVSMLPKEMIFTEGTPEQMLDDDQLLEALEEFRRKRRAAEKVDGESTTH